MFVYFIELRSDRDRVSMSGTSMACPTVAGAVALLLQRFPNYTPAQIKQQLQDEATQGAINMRTYRGGFLPTIIQAETTNRLVYTGKARQCGKLDVLHSRTLAIWEYLKWLYILCRASTGNVLRHRFFYVQTLVNQLFSFTLQCFSTHF